MAKIIFLDIDGVLNSRDWFSTDTYKVAAEGLSSAELMLIRHDLHIDPIAVSLLNDLVDKSGADIVLSSTWRQKYDPEAMTSMLAGRGFKFKVVDRTPALFGKFNSSRIPRGKEIAAYLRSLQEQPEAFVILDDNDDMLHLKKFLVLTTKKHGLTQEDVGKALKILSGEAEDDPQVP